MGLSLQELAQGRELIHEYRLESLNDTIKIREISSGEMNRLFTDYKAEESGRLNEAGTKRLIMLTLTDDTNASMTEQQVDAFFEAMPQSVIVDVVKGINKVHGGEGEGES